MARSTVGRYQLSMEAMCSWLACSICADQLGKLSLAMSFCTLRVCVSGSHRLMNLALSRPPMPTVPR